VCDFHLRWFPKVIWQLLDGIGKFVCCDWLCLGEFLLISA